MGGVSVLSFTPLVHVYIGDSVQYVTVFNIFNIFSVADPRI